jgi:hypothetical protein
MVIGPKYRTRDERDAMEFTRSQRTACPACGAESLTSLPPVQDHVSGVWFDVGQCNACTFVFLSNPPIASDLGPFYDNPSGAIMHSTPPVIVQKARDVAMRGEVSRLLKFVPAGSRVADIGAGDGSLAEVMLRMGLDPLAVDIFPSESWKHSGIDYLQYDPAADPAEIFANTRGVYAVTMRHVLEHVLEPVDMLSTFAKQGIEVVSVVVPNIESRLAKAQGADWYYWDPPRHLSFFSPSTLTTVADRAGYEVADLKLVGLDELVTARHRAALLDSINRGRRHDALVRATRPTGVLASFSSAMVAPVGRATIKAILRRTP